MQSKSFKTFFGGNSFDQNMCRAARQWLTDRIRELPNDLSSQRQILKRLEFDTGVDFNRLWRLCRDLDLNVVEVYGSTRR